MRTYEIAFSEYYRRTDEAFTSLLSKLRPGSRVLELGFGYRTFNYSAALPVVEELVLWDPKAEKAHLFWAGIDISYGESTEILGSKVAFAKPTGPFDLIAMRSVLHEAHNILEQTLKLLSPGGRLFLADWTYWGVPKDIARQVVEELRRKGYPSHEPDLFFHPWKLAESLLSLSYTIETLEIFKISLGWAPHLWRRAFILTVQK